MNPAVAVFTKELRLLRRDPQLLFLQLVMPVIVLVVFSSLFTITLRKVSVAMVDRDGTAAARQVTRELRDSPYFDVQQGERAESALDSGADLAVVSVPEGYGRRGRGTQPLQVLVDGTGSAAGAAQGYLEAFTDNIGAVEPSSMRPAADAVTATTWFNPERADSTFFLPGIIVLVLFCGPAVYCATSLVREKETGTWSMLAASPIGDWELIFGKLAPYILQAALQATLLFVVARFVFHLPFRGSDGLVALSTFLFILASIALGTLFAAVSSTEGGVWRFVQVFLMLPGLVLSGFIYPITSLPAPAQFLSRLFPARSYLEVLRGVLLKSADADAMQPQLLTLAGFAFGCLFLAVIFLRRSRRVQ